MATHWGCVATDPQFDAGNTDSNQNQVYGEKFYVKFPPKRQDDGRGPSLPYQQLSSRRRCVPP